jgi:hypothetical protein
VAGRFPEKCSNRAKLAEPLTRALSLDKSLQAHKLLQAQESLQAEESLQAKGRFKRNRSGCGDAT